MNTTSSRTPARVRGGGDDDRRGAVEAPEAVEGDSDGGSYRVSYDGSTESVATAVISAVATVSGTDVTELEPLSAVVDPDALNGLFEPTAPGASSSERRVRFVYNDCEVTVHANDGITVVDT